MKQNRLRVCVDARLDSGMPGGIEQFIIGLAKGLSHVARDNEEYLFLVNRGSTEWIEPYVSGRCTLLYTKAAPRVQPKWRQRLAQVPAVRSAVDRLRDLRAAPINVARSDGTLEESGAALIHFTMQGAFLTQVPSIYQPWDLQHVHLPEFFKPQQRALRNALYRTFCNHAQLVVVASEWGRRDIMEQFELPADRVLNIAPAPVLAAYEKPSPETVQAVKQKFGLPERFLFYPAQTFAHKNHVRLFEALRLLRDEQGVTIPLVCSGRQSEYFPSIRQAIAENGLEDQVRFLGWISTDELQSLYALATAMIFPSKFEGWGLPIGEALFAGLPIAAARVTCIPEQAGDAALYFDPDNTNAIADAALRIWTDSALRARLVEQGRQRVANSSWERVAEQYRTQYYRVAGLISDELSDVAV